MIVDKNDNFHSWLLQGGYTVPTKLSDERKYTFNAEYYLDVTLIYLI